jgi:phosphohistidine swiveling domain-containing protein
MELPAFFSNLERFATRPSSLQRDSICWMFWNEGQVPFVSVPYGAGTREYLSERGATAKLHAKLAREIAGSEPAWGAHVARYESSVRGLHAASRTFGATSGRTRAEIAASWRGWSVALRAYAVFFLTPYSVERELDPALRAGLREAFGTAGDATNAEKAFAVIVSPGRLNAFQDMRVAICDAVLLGQNEPQAAVELANRFGWYSEYAYVEPLLDAAHFEKELRALTPKTASAEKTRLLTHVEENERAFEALMVTLPDSGNLRALARAVHEYTFLRTDRIDQFKQAQARVRALYDQIAGELAAHSGNRWTRQGVLSCTNQELDAFFERGVVPEVTLVSQRAAGNYVYIIDRGKETVLTGPAAVRAALDVIHPPQNHGGLVKGSPAFHGKARGRVVIVKTKADLPRVRPGDVMVANITIPEYTPVMKRVCAIVTDEGGVTSHAAIVSREFGIPCVVGTRHATQAFQEGDTVEVDATNGVVRKIG